MMTKWDTIQEDIKDAYAHLDDVDELEQEDEEDFFGFSKAIYINPYIKDLVFPVVFDTVGGAWYPPNNALYGRGRCSERKV